MSKIVEINKDEYENIIWKWENDYLDYKSSIICPKNLVDSIVSFANSESWELYIWIKEIKNKSKIEWYECDGFSKIEDFQDHIWLYNETQPSIIWLNHVFFKYNDKYILKFIIPKSSNLHYTKKGKCYIRRWSRNFEIKWDEIEELKFIKWIKKYEDSIIDIDYNIVLNSLYFKDFIYNENKYWNLLSDFNYLFNNNFIDKNKIPRVSTILWFLDNPQVHLKAWITISVYWFQKNSRTHTYSRDRVINTLKIIWPIEVLIKKSIDFIKKHFTDNKINYSLIAIKEAIVNSIIHREYSIQDDIKIEIFDNQIEITNPWLFPWNDKNINPLKFQRNARNPKLYWILSRISDFEPNIEDKLNQDRWEWIKTIWNLAKKWKFSNPSYEFKNWNTTIILNFASIQTYDKKILNYISKYWSIANKEAREETWEEDKEKIKNVFKRLERQKKIKRENENAPLSKIRYILVKYNKESIVQSLF